MTTNSIHTVIQENVDPVLEVIIRGLVEARLHPENQPQAAETVTAALAQVLLTSMAQQPVLPPERHISPLVQALASTLAATLAPALAAALSPTLANMLTPIIVDALTQMELPNQQQAQGQEDSEQSPQG